MSFGEFRRIESESKEVINEEGLFGGRTAGEGGTDGCGRMVAKLDFDS